MCLRVLSFSPWSEQRKIRRAFYLGAKDVVAVCGRQVGKTEEAIDETIREALDNPGSVSALVAPTFPIARVAINKMKLRLREVPGTRWLENQKVYEFPNGSRWHVYSADNPDSLRGPTITGLLWFDEAAMIADEAWTTIRGAQAAAGNPRRLFTTTPKGLNWVKDIWDLGRKGTHPDIVSLRFPTIASPFCNLREVRDAWSAMAKAPEKFAQEYFAEFVDALIIAFPDRSRLYVTRHKDRRGERDIRNALGVDFGKDQDWTVVTLTNKHGEMTVLDRWQNMTYPDTTERVLGYIRQHSVEVLCLDDGGAGHSVGDYLEREKLCKVLRVKTNVIGQKAEVVEQARMDVQYGKVFVERGPEPIEGGLPSEQWKLVEQLDHEFARFQGTKYVVQGEEHVKYEGLQVRGEFDDCVISFCLANWARVYGWEHGNPLLGDFSAFGSQPAPSQPVIPRMLHSPSRKARSRPNKFNSPRRAGGFGGFGYR